MANCLAIITARGGSKRIPHKNIKDFLGKPIITYSITAAIQAGCFTEVMVSTDDDNIASIAKSAGAAVPFMRSPQLSDDYSTIAQVIEEVLASYKNIGKEFEHFCCLFPTAPFITALKLKNAYDKLIETKAHSILPIVKFGFPILRSFKIENGLVKMNWPEFKSIRSQDMPLAYHDCGQFYFLRTDIFLKEKEMFTSFAVPFEMQESEVQDIDTLEDWKIAEMKYQLIH